MNYDKLLIEWKDNIISHTNFSFIKYGDGEFNCMMGLSGLNCDKHPYTKELSDKLYDSWYFLSSLDNIYISLWHTMSFYDELLSKTKNIKANLIETGYEILLQNNLTENKFNFLKSIKETNRKKIFIGPNRLKGVIDFLNINFFIEVPLINSFSEYEKVLNEIYTHIQDYSIFLFSSGMMTKSLIHKILEKNRNVTCLDIGSGFDSIFVGLTRSGQNPEKVKMFYQTLLERK